MQAVGHQDSLPPNRDVIKGYGGIRDEFRRLKYGEMTFFGFMNNQFERVQSMALCK